MSSDKKAFELNFNLYLGDPDDGVASISSVDVLENFGSHQETLPFADGLYGHLTLQRAGKSQLEPIPDPIARMLTSLARVMPYVLEGEPESALMQESEHGFLLEPNGENVLFSVFSGNDAYDPEEYVLEAESMPLIEFGDQLVQMCNRLLQIFEKNGSDDARDTDSIEDLQRILDVAREAVKSAKLKNEHGIGHH